MNINTKDIVNSCGNSGCGRDGKAVEAASVILAANRFRKKTYKLAFGLLRATMGSFATVT